MEKEILLRFLKCETSAEEENAVLEWLEASPEHRDELNRLDAAFNAVVLHAPNGAALRRQRLFGGLRLRPRRLLRYAGAVAAALILMVGGGWLFASRQVRTFSERMNSIEVPAGQRISMTLQDGTKVWLNSGTTLTYPAVFSHRDRRVEVSGEAMFDVAPDAEHPFIVETYACDVEVLGTKFNVRAEESENIFSTALMRGRVKVSNRLSSGAGESIYMNPDDCVELVDGHLTLGHIEDPAEYLWPEGIINLHSASFEELIEKFERAYGIRIIIERKELPRIRCRGKIHVSEGIDHALDILRMDADFTYEHDYNRNEIHIR